jgi:hypothetical protein
MTFPNVAPRPCMSREVEISICSQIVHLSCRCTVLFIWTASSWNWSCASFMERVRVNYSCVGLFCDIFCLWQALQPFVGPWPLFQFLNPTSIHSRRTHWTGDQPVVRPLPTHITTQTENKRTQTSMSRVGFEPTIPVFERTKTVHALDRAAAVIGLRRMQQLEYVSVEW